MKLDIQFTTQQINDFASGFLLTDIKALIEKHQKEIEKIIKEEQTEDNNFTSDNSVWTFYTDNAICKVKLDKNDNL